MIKILIPMGLLVILHSWCIVRLMKRTKANEERILETRRHAWNLDNAVGILDRRTKPYRVK